MMPSPRTRASMTQERMKFLLLDAGLQTKMRRRHAARKLSEDDVPLFQQGMLNWVLNGGRILFREEDVTAMILRDWRHWNELYDARTEAATPKHARRAAPEKAA